MVRTVDAIRSTLKAFQDAIELLEHSDGSVAELSRSFADALMPLGPPPAVNSANHRDFKSYQLRQRSLMDARVEFDRAARPWRARALIAMREGALQIYHFTKAIKEVPISALRQSAPVFESNLDHTLIRAARRDSEKLFGLINPIRNAIAHAKEPNARGDYADGATVAGQRISDGPIFIDDSRSGATYATSFGGKVHEYELSRATLGELERIYAKLRLGIKAAVKASWDAKFRGGPLQMKPRKSEE